MPEVRLRRVYDEPGADDGSRVLVDRLWPRGLSRQAARVDEWAKAAAPSDELRRWYGHDPDKFGEFTRRYLFELADPERAACLARLARAAGAGTVTLLTASKDIGHSQAAVLARRLSYWEDEPGDGACLQCRVCPRCGGVAAENPPTTCPDCGEDMPGD